MPFSFRKRSIFCPAILAFSYSFFAEEHRAVGAPTAPAAADDGNLTNVVFHKYVSFVIKDPLHYIMFFEKGKSFKNFLYFFGEKERLSVASLLFFVNRRKSARNGGSFLDFFQKKVYNKFICC